MKTASRSLRSVPTGNTVMAQRIVAKRKKDGLTMKQAARGIGISLTTVFRLETGARPTSVAMLLKVARWLGADPGDLL